MIGGLRRWAKTALRDLDAAVLACGDRRMPWHVRLLALAIVAYAVSPIDLIPDFIPVIGLLDDLVLLPLGLLLFVRLTPPHLLSEYRSSHPDGGRRKGGRLAAGAILGLWAAAAIAAWSAFG